MQRMQTKMSERSVVIPLVSARAGKRRRKIFTRERFVAQLSLESLDTAKRRGEESRVPRVTRIPQGRFKSGELMRDFNSTSLPVYASLVGRTNGKRTTTGTREFRAEEARAHLSVMRFYFAAV